MLYGCFGFYYRCFVHNSSNNYLAHNINITINIRNQINNGSVETLSL